MCSNLIGLQVTTNYNKFKIIEKENLKFQLNNIQSINNETYFIELDFHGEYVIINDLVEMPLFKSNQKTMCNCPERPFDTHNIF